MLAFFFALIWMATEIPVIGSILKAIIFIIIVCFLGGTYVEYQKITQKEADRAVQYNSYYR